MMQLTVTLKMTTVEMSVIVNYMYSLIQDKQTFLGGYVTP